MKHHARLKRSEEVPPVKRKRARRRSLSGYTLANHMKEVKHASKKELEEHFGKCPETIRRAIQEARILGLMGDEKYAIIWDNKGLIYVSARYDPTMYRKVIGTGQALVKYVTGAKNIALTLESPIEYGRQAILIKHPNLLTKEIPVVEKKVKLITKVFDEKEKDRPLGAL